MAFFKHWVKQAVAVAVLAGSGAAINVAVAADIDYGKQGTPFKLVIGYQPYYTEAWSGVVMRGKKFYEKYLPKGSEVEFQVGLQGAIIVNNMLAGKQHIGYMGDMPSIVSTTKQDVADIRLVAAVGLGYGRAGFCQCPGCNQVAKRQAGCGAQGELYRPLRASVIPQAEHPAQRILEPEHRGDYQQLPCRQN
jgi:hypothetical protein